MRAAEHPVQRVEADAAQGQQLDHRFEGDGKDQPFVFFPGGNMAGTKENREQGDQGAKGQGYTVAHRFPGKNADRIGHCLYLQGQQGQHADQHENGGQGTGPGAAKAEGEQVGQG
ncbi:hypothetical protein D9M71_279840 [compost metagenome]